MQHSTSWAERYAIQVLAFLYSLWLEEPVQRNWLGQEKYCIALKSLVTAPKPAL